MTLYSLLNAPDMFRAGIAGAPVTSWRNYDTIYTERYMGLPSENADGYTRQLSRRRTPPSFKSKLLMVHNIEDDNVLFQNTHADGGGVGAGGQALRHGGVSAEDPRRRR